MALEIAKLEGSDEDDEAPAADPVDMSARCAGSRATSAGSGQGPT